MNILMNLSRRDMPIRFSPPYCKYDMGEVYLAVGELTACNQFASFKVIRAVFRQVGPFRDLIEARWDANVT